MAILNKHKIATAHSYQNLLVLVAALSCAWLIIYVVYRIAFDPLRKIPGPFTARFTNFWEVCTVLRGNWHNTIIKLHKRHGPIVRIGPNRYDVSDPTAIKIIYALSAGFPKSEFYETFGPPGQNGLLTIPHNELHAEMRRKVASLYSMSTLLSYEPAVNDQTAVLEDKFRHFALENRTINLPDFMQFYAFDVIGKITTADAMGMMPAEGDPYGLVRGIDEMHDYVAVVGLISAWHWYIYHAMRILRVSPPGVGLLKYVRERIERRRHEFKGDDGSDFLTKLLRSEAEGKINGDDVFMTVINNVVAGSDTTGISLGSTLYHIYRNPEVLEKLRAEMEDMEEQGQVSDPVTYSETQRMPYLRAVIKESLRLHPAVGKQLSRTVPKGGKIICGQFFPQGTEIGVNAWSVHFDPEVFGSDATIFRPERWLEGKRIGESQLFAFGGGSRACIGKNISLLEMSKVLPQIYRKFNIRITDKDRKHPETRWSSWFVKQKYLAQIEVRDRGVRKGG